MSAPAPALNAKRTALLVMDYQSGTLASMPDQAGLDALLGRVEGAIADVRAHRGTIAYVRVAFTEAEWDAVPDTNKIFSAVAKRRAMHHEDPATAIHERLTPQAGYVGWLMLRRGR